MTVKRNIKHWFQKKTRGWSDDECWNLDYNFIKWINTRFKKYKEQAKIDLTFHKFVHRDGITYTQGELIDRIIFLSDTYIEYVNGDFFKRESTLKNIVDEIFDIFKLIFWTMWW